MSTDDAVDPAADNVRWFADLGMGDLEVVGGKNASLGEMISNLADAGVTVPDGFATTAAAYQRFLGDTGLAGRIADRLRDLDTDDVRALADAGKSIRASVVEQEFPAELEADIRTAYEQLAGADGEASFAVRSSATAEDLPDASFAGQQETFLNVRGVDAVLQAIREVYASLYNDRAIAYRVHHGFDHGAVSLSAGVQKMVRSDLAASGVAFTVDTESGFPDAVFVTAAYGLGEDAAVGRTTEFVDVDPAERGKLSLTDDEVLELARQAVRIEEHYGRPMDIEWGKDGLDGKLYILQARPETVQSRSGSSSERFKLTGSGTVLVEGRAIGQKIGAGAVKVLSDIEQMHEFTAGDVLVADMTDPDWEPIMKRASAIVTNRGGRTCHAAIIARELGIPAVVGTGDATKVLADGREVTVSCAEGDTGNVYEGSVDFEVEETRLDAMPDIPTKIMMNVGTPEQAFAFSRLPHAGVGLARLEFIINRQIGIHPRALLELDDLEDDDLRKQITERVAAYPSPRDYFVQRVAEGVSMIAAAFAPEPVIVRMSDFKSNEYANLLGGERYEPHEENPMLGYRGASRYLSEEFADCFAMECEALRFVRDDMGLTNVEVMIPFVRTLTEARGVVDLLAENGLRRGENDLQVVMMCELPSNAILAGDFLEHFDGFSIGSNDMTQLTLGLDRDSSLVAAGFDERDPAVLSLLAMAIAACRERGKYVGICGQGPSDHPEMAEWLVDQGIESMSLNPDTVIDTWLHLAKATPAST
jgi:pyruvate,water dikinase